MAECAEAGADSVAGGAVAVGDHLAAVHHHPLVPVLHGVCGAHTCSQGELEHSISSLYSTLLLHGFKLYQTIFQSNGTLDFGVHM